MLARKCDRCGALYMPVSKQIDGKNMNGILTIFREANEKYRGMKTYDLCENCQLDFAKWLSDGKSDGEEQDLYEIPPYPGK